MKDKMKHTKALSQLLLFIAIISLASCLKEADFSGFLRSTDRVESRFKELMQWNENHPFRDIYTNEENYKLFITSDVHVGGPKTNNNYAKFVDKCIHSDIVAAVYAGDLSSGREDAQKLFQSMLPPDSIVPSFLMIGNHELYFDGWKYYYKLFGSSTYYFTITTPTKKDLYICLDSGSGTLGKSQLDWLKKLLESMRSNFDRCIVFTHSNFFRTHHTASTSPNMDELLVLLDLFESHNVSMVITGHDHKRDEKIVGNIPYIILDALRDDAKNATYMILQKNQTAFDYEFVKP